MAKDSKKIAIDGKVVKDLLAEASVGQEQLAEAISVSRQTVSDWLNNNQIPPKRLLDISAFLSWTPAQHTSVLSDPFSKMIVQFRSNRNVQIDTEKSEELQEVAKDFFKLNPKTEVESLVHLSSNDTKTMAKSILKELNIRQDAVTLDGTLRSLERFGISVLFFDFGEKLRAAKAQAACACLNERYVIFVDTNEALEDLLWRIFHEVCHLFCRHTTVSEDQEEFCNQVATEIVTPSEYFLSNKARLKKIFTEPKSRWVNEVKSIAASLSASFEGVTLSLKRHGIIDDAGRNYLYVCFNRWKPNRQRVSNKLTSPSSYPESIKFWTSSLNDPSLAKFMKFHNMIQFALTEGRMSLGRAADLFNVDEKTIEELSVEWMKMLEPVSANPAFDL